MKERHKKVVFNEKLSKKHRVFYCLSKNVEEYKIKKALSITKWEFFQFSEEFYNKKKKRRHVKQIQSRIKNSDEQKRHYLQGRLDLTINHPISTKLRRFLGKNYNNSSIKEFFTMFGRMPICALTGKKININLQKTYSLDHIIPRCNGGKDTFDNMQVTISSVNYMKTHFDNEFFIEICNFVAKTHPREV